MPILVAPVASVPLRLARPPAAAPIAARFSQPLARHRARLLHTRDLLPTCGAARPPVALAATANLHRRRGGPRAPSAAAAAGRLPRDPRRPALLSQPPLRPKRRGLVPVRLRVGERPVVGVDDTPPRHAEPAQARLHGRRAWQ